jgi:hypothetical protein
MRVLRLTLVALTLCCTLLAGASVQADGYDDRRTRAGARLFRALLAAELGIESKADPDGTLHVVLLGGRGDHINDVAELIAPSSGDEAAEIRSVPITLDRLRDLGELGQRRPAAIFLADIPSDTELQQLVEWSIAQRVLLYSPFEGHVERGVMAGLSVEAKVLPYLNMTTLNAAGVELKPLFIRVAKLHR